MQLWDRVGSEAGLIIPVPANFLFLSSFSSRLDDFFFYPFFQTCLFFFFCPIWQIRSLLMRLVKDFTIDN